MSHLMSSTTTLIENDEMRREEAIAKAGVEVLDDIEYDEPISRASDDLLTGGLPEGAEPLPDVEPPPSIDLPEIGTPVRYHARNGFMRRRQSAFPATVLGLRPDEGTVDLLVSMDSEDTIVEERVAPWSDDHQHHVFALIGGGEEANRQEIEKLWGEFGLLRAQIFGEYVDPPKSVMEYLAQFEAKLAAITAVPESAQKPARARKG